MKRRLLVSLALVLASCSPPPAPAPAPPAPAPAKKKKILDDDQRRVFRPLPARFGTAGTPEQIALGKALFFDPRLSASGDVSCQSCHILAHGGDDDRSVSVGHQQQAGTRNAPSVWNVAGHFRFFWDGRAATLEEQVRGPMLNPKEMGNGKDVDVERALRKIAGYAPLFAAAFPERPVVDVDNAARAIAAFERELRAPSRYDTWAAGDDDALDDAEEEGALAFMATGCMSCHQSGLFGGLMFQKAGAVKPWFNTADKGRAAVTGNVDDEFVFKVPSLRNVALTAPYFSDGSVDELPEAVRRMARHQLGKELSDADVARLVKFLNTLSADVDGDEFTALVEAPTLP